MAGDPGYKPHWPGLHDTHHEKTDLKVFSLSYQKKDGRVWHDTNFSEFDSADIIDYILEKSVSYQKKDVCFLVMCVT